MKLFRLLSTLILSTHLLYSEVQSKASLNQMMDAYLIENQFQGAVLIAKNQEILFKQGYGYANVEHGIPNTPDTIFRIASISKQFTAAAILHLQDKGLLHVSDPINKYLPNYPNGKLMTIHHLLCHTSGISNLTALPNLAEIQRLPSTPDLIISYFKDLPLRFLPGSDCEYSDSNYILLGTIVEAVSQQSYADYLNENFFQPLALNSTKVELPYLVIQQRASGYRKDTNNFIRHAPYIDMSFPYAAGGLVSSVEDLYQWSLALHKATLLTQASTQSLFTIQAAKPEHQITYGYGFRIGPQNAGFEGCNSSIVGHLGTIEGFKAAAIYYQDEDVMLILLSNVEQTDIRKLHKELAQILFAYWRDCAA